MSRSPIPARPLGAVSLSLVLAILMVLGALSGPPASGAPAAGAAAPGKAMAPSGPIPDSVLARVGPRRMVSVAMFRHAWKQVQDPQHPDSLTPQAARQFLDLMISKEALGERALASTAPWPHRDSLEFLAFRDRLMMKAVLDSALAETARRRRVSGEPELGRMDIGVAARETAMTRLDVRYDTVLAARLALAWKALPVPPSDSSMTAQNRMRQIMPEVTPADTGRAIARSSIGDYRVSELVTQWRWLDPWARPRIETPEEIEGLVRNGLFERLLRAESGERHLERRPELAAMIESRREYTAVAQLVSREVYSKIHPDAAAMNEWYRTHSDLYQIPDRARIGRWTMPDRAGAGRLAALLRDPMAADSLIEQGRRTGADFRDEITAGTDSALYREARRLGAGTVVGPDSVPGGWRVVRVMTLEPARVRSFDEAHDFIVKDMTDSLGEVGMRQLVQRVRKETPVTVNSKALAKLTAAP